MTIETSAIDKTSYYKIELFIENSLELANINCEESCKIVLLKKGTLDFSISEKDFHVTSPALICLNPKDRIQFSSDNIEVSCLYFHPKALNCLFEYEFIDKIDINSLNYTTIHDLNLLHAFNPNDMNRKIVYQITYDSFLSINRLMYNAKKELDDQYDGYWVCRSRSYFIEMLFVIDRISRNIEEKSQLEYTAEDIMEYLSENISSRLTLNDLTSRYLMNRNKLNKLFKKETGMTFIQYFNKIKIDMSSNLITHTELSIKEIASRVGYDTITDFSKFFKKNVGSSPKQYREINS